jgi:succinyl-CoA synthetase alpha subunit
MNWFPPNKVIIQGITDSQATFYAVQMKAYGAEIVAGVSPGSGGTKVDDIPVFDLVEQVLNQVTEIDISLVFVHPYQVLDAVTEAIAVGIKCIIVFTPQVPPLDTIKLIKYAEANKVLILGPGSQGIMIPQQVWLGTLQPQFYRPGNVGIITTSQHLSYEVAAELNQADMGQSMIVSLGEDPIVGSSLLQWLAILNEDPNTKAIVSISQSINEVEEIISHCKSHGYDKPIVVYIAGLKAPQEKVFRDAVTILSNHLSASIPAINRDRQKIIKLKKAGIKVAKKPSEIPYIIQAALTVI